MEFCFWVYNSCCVITHGVIENTNISQVKIIGENRNNCHLHIVEAKFGKGRVKVHAT